MNWRRITLAVLLSSVALLSCEAELRRSTTPADASAPSAIPLSECWQTNCSEPESPRLQGSAEITDCDHSTEPVEPEFSQAYGAETADCAGHECYLKRAAFSLGQDATLWFVSEVRRADIAHASGIRLSQYSKAGEILSEQLLRFDEVAEGASVSYQPVIAAHESQGLAIAPRRDAGEQGAVTEQEVLLLDREGQEQATLSLWTGAIHHLGFDEAGALYVLGETEAGELSVFKWAMGAPQWVQTRLPSRAHATAFSAVIPKAGGLVLRGIGGSRDGGVHTFLARHSDDGEPLWHWQDPEGDLGVVGALGTTHEGAVIESIQLNFSGSVSGGEATHLLKKWSADGELLWIQRHVVGPDLRGESPNSAASAPTEDAQGNVVAASAGVNSAREPTFVLRRFSDNGETCKTFELLDPNLFLPVTQVAALADDSIAYLSEHSWGRVVLPR